MNSVLDRYYNHYVSLGARCFIAIDFRYLKMKFETLPFDWLYTKSFPIVLQLLSDKSSQKNILQRKNLLQDITSRFMYFDELHKIWYIHDFDDFIPLGFQLRYVKRKYKRRFKRLNVIKKEPTLFVYYIDDQINMDYIEKNYSHIVQLIKSLNADSNILFIARKNLKVSNSFCVIVEDAPEGIGLVNRVPITSTPELKEYFSCAAQLLSTTKHSISFIKKMSMNFHRAYYWLLHKIFKTKFIHSRTINKDFSL